MHLSHWLSYWQREHEASFVSLCNAQTKVSQYLRFAGSQQGRYLKFVLTMGAIWCEKNIHSMKHWLSECHRQILNGDPKISAYPELRAIHVGLAKRYALPENAANEQKACTPFASVLAKSPELDLLLFFPNFGRAQVLPDAESCS